MTRLMYCMHRQFLVMAKQGPSLYTTFLCSVGNRTVALQLVQSTSSSLRCVRPVMTSALLASLDSCAMARLHAHITCTTSCTAWHKSVTAGAYTTGVRRASADAKEAKRCKQAQVTRLPQGPSGLGIGHRKPAAANGAAPGSARGCCQV